jgi:hypothetical protein
MTVTESQIAARKRFKQSITNSCTPTFPEERVPLSERALRRYFAAWGGTVLGRDAANRLARPIGEILAILHAARDRGEAELTERGWRFVDKPAPKVQR